MYSQANRKKTAFHIAGCAMFLSLPFLFSPDLGNSASFFRIRGFRSDFIFHVFLILFFYLNYYVLSDKLLFARKFVRYGLVLLLSFFALQFGSKLLSNVFRSPQDVSFNMPGAKPPHTGNPDWTKHHGPPPHEKFFGRHLGQDIGKHIFQFILLVVFSTLLKINQKRKLAESEKTKLELGALKSQIQPHFLFNTLNSIYALSMIERSKNTGSAIIKLSEMMRYVLKDTENEYVDLKDEINYVTNYIDLQRLRLAENIELDYTVAEELSGSVIAPMILITFIENAFKFGVNPEQASKIAISIVIDNHVLSLKSYNNKVTIQSLWESRGIGIENTKKRLDALYPGKYTLVIEDKPASYEVDLTIALN